MINVFSTRNYIYLLLFCNCGRIFRIGVFTAVAIVGGSLTNDANQVSAHLSSLHYDFFVFPGMKVQSFTYN